MHTTDVIQHVEHTRCLRFLRVAINRGMGTSDTTAFTPCAITLEPRTRFHWPLFLISSLLMRGCTQTLTLYKLSSKHNALVKNSTYIPCNVHTLGSLTAPVTYSQSLLSRQTSGTAPKNTALLHTPSRHGLTTRVSL